MLIQCILISVLLLWYRSRGPRQGGEFGVDLGVEVVREEASGKEGKFMSVEAMLKGGEDT